MASYKLYDLTGREVTPKEVESRSLWYELGESGEFAFVAKFGDQLNVKINPEKSHNPSEPDLECHGNLADLKIQTTPFFQSSRYGMNPQNTVTFNLKDAWEYGAPGKDYKNFTIFYWVKWLAIHGVGRNWNTKVEPLSGVWRIPFEQLDEVRKSAPVHWYVRRGQGTPEPRQDAAQRLLKFEPRLFCEERKVAMSLRGYGGNAACSYLLNLDNFERVC